MNYGLSGKLTEDTNTVNGVVVIYSEPAESRKTPVRRPCCSEDDQNCLSAFYIVTPESHAPGLWGDCRDPHYSSTSVDHVLKARSLVLPPYSGYTRALANLHHISHRTNGGCIRTKGRRRLM